ncbi:MAG TPA: 2-dehydropantoate 2-reductase [Sphingomicrobium sp.]|nr:2-dehydropantoate 2-reductase [Sphingomicrobium sp.]
MTDRRFETITIVGAGAIGGWVAARLAMAGNRVSILARDSTLVAIRTGGLRISDGETIATVLVDASGAADELGRRDLVVIAVKAPALADAAEAARPLIGRETLILPMLNGVPWWFTGEPLVSVDPGGRIAAALPLDQLVGCVVHASCSRAAANHILVNHADKLIVGEPAGGSSDRVEALAALFGSAGIGCEASADVRSAIWYKLWGNATLNPLSALTRATADRLIGDPQLRSWMLEAMAELAQVGEAIGCPIAESGEDRMAVTAKLGAFKTSMLQDVGAGRPIELDALLGAPVEIARRAGIATPRLDLLYAMSRQLAVGAG